MTRAGLARLSTAFVASVCLSGLVASAQGGGRYSAALVPDQEVPAVSSEASGTITLDIDDGEREITYELTFSGLADVAQAHIHFAQPGVNGGIVLWLCQGNRDACTRPRNRPARHARRAAPSAASLSSGRNVTANARCNAQQILPASSMKPSRSSRRDSAYANVHTAASGGGEIRGQIRQGGGH